MGFMDELKKLTRPYAEDDDDFDEEFDLDESSRGSRAPRTRGTAAPRTARSSENIYDDVPETSGSSSRPFGGASRFGESKVVNIHSGSQSQVVLVKPDRFDNVSEIAEHLRSKHAVVLNLEATNKDVSRRLVDFLSGCAYALDGKIKKIAIATYIITPCNMDVIGDLLDDLESNGTYL